eukprot:m.28452 g.28452  ORF g.28452 m.28452 type:complete len:2168 (-) comp8001_c0_seq2:149-6652(-)
MSFDKDKGRGPGRPNNVELISIGQSARSSSQTSRHQPNTQRTGHSGPPLSGLIPNLSGSGRAMTASPSIVPSDSRPTKRMKFGGGSGSSSTLVPATNAKQDNAYQDTEKFVELILEKWTSGNAEATADLLLPAFEYLLDPSKTASKALHLAIMVICSKDPGIFRQPKIVDFLVGILSWKSVQSMKLKAKQTVPLLVAVLLYVAHRDVPVWPRTFVNVYLGDALGERVWTAHEDARAFVHNIETAFGMTAAEPNKGEPKDAIGDDEWDEEEMTTSAALDDEWAEEEMTTSASVMGPSSATPAPNGIELISPHSRDLANPETTSATDKSSSSRNTPEIKTVDEDVAPRFMKDDMQAAQEMVVTAVKEYFTLSKRVSPAESSRNLLKIMIASASVPEMRVMASMNLMPMIASTNESRLVVDLFAALGKYGKGVSPQNKELVQQLMKIKITGKKMSSMLTKSHIDCIRDIVSSHPDLCKAALETILRSEVMPGNSQQPSNKANNALFDACLRALYPTASSILGTLCLEMLANHPDYRASLRLAMRKAAESKHFQLTGFSRAMMSVNKPNLLSLAPPQREVLVAQISEMLGLACLCHISPEAMEQAKGISEQSKTFVNAALLTAKQEICAFQALVVGWVAPQQNGTQPDEVRKFVPAPSKLYIYILRNVLFLAASTVYFGTREEQLSEKEQLQLWISRNDMIISETILQKLISMGLSSHPLPVGDTLNIIWDLVRRSARPNFCGDVALEIRDKQMLDKVLHLACYTPPVKIPGIESLPKLAVSQLYWQAWSVVFVLMVSSPKTLGEHAWSRFPVIRAMTEMCMTSSYSQHISEDGTENEGSFLVMNAGKERQRHTSERDQILRLETELAKACNQPIPTETASKLLGQVCNFDPTGPVRRMPSAWMGEVQRLERDLRMKRVLCRSRNPDFMQRVILKTGSSKAMDWIVPLVDQIGGILESLPVPALCEIYFRDQHHMEQVARKDDKAYQQRQIRTILVKVLEEEGDQGTDLANFFLERLHRGTAMARRKARDAFASLVLETTVAKQQPISRQDESAWLMNVVPALSSFFKFKHALYSALGTSILVVSDLSALQYYVMFLSTHVQPEDPPYGATVNSIAKVIVTRSAARMGLLRNEKLCNEVVNFFARFCTHKVTLDIPGAPIELKSKSHGVIKANEDILSCILYALSALCRKRGGDVSESHKALLTLILECKQKTISQFLNNRKTHELNFALLKSSNDDLADCVLENANTDFLVDALHLFGISMSVTRKILSKLDSEDPKKLKGLLHNDVLKRTLLKKIEILRRGDMNEGAKFEVVLKMTQPSKRARKEENMEAMDVSHKEVPAKNETETSACTPDEAVALLEKIVVSSESDISDAQTRLQNELRTCIAEGVQTSVFSALRTHIISKLENSNDFITRLIAKPDITAPLLALLLHDERQESHQADAEGKTKYSKLPLHISLSNILSNKDVQESLSMAAPVLTTLLWHCRDISLKLQAKKCFLVPPVLRPFDWSASDVLSKLSGKKKHEVGMHTKRLLMDLSKTETNISTKIDNIVSILKAFLAYDCDTIDEETGVLFQQLVTTRGLRDHFPIILQSSLQSKNRVILMDWISAAGPSVMFNSQTSAEHGNVQNTSITTTMNLLSSSPFLVSWLLCDAPWPKIEETLLFLLKNTASESNHEHENELKPSFVLNLATACVRHPRLWLGSTDTGKGRGFWRPTVNQAVLLGVNIIRELVMSDEDVHTQLQGRVPLLLCGASSDRDLLEMANQLDSINLDKVVQVSQEVSDPVNQELTESKASIAHAGLLASLYASSPRLLRFAPLHLSHAMTSFAQTTSLDVVLHKLVVALLELRPEETAESLEIGDRRTEVAYRILRNLAMRHTTEVIGMIPVIAKLMHGATLATGEIERKIDLQRTHLLGLLEALKPTIFSEKYIEKLSGGLKPLWELVTIASQGHNPRYISLLNQMMAFLRDYLKSEPLFAREEMNSRHDLLYFVEHHYPEVNMKDILQSLQTGSVTVLSSEEPYVMDLVARLREDLRDSLSSNKFFGNLAAKTALNTLDTESQTNPHILEHVADELVSLLKAQDSTRETAYKLILRLLNHSPSMSDFIAPSFLTCLSAESYDVVQTALKHAPDFFICAPQVHEPLLRAIFSSSERGMIDATATIKEILRTVHLS